MRLIAVGKAVVLLGEEVESYISLGQKVVAEVQEFLVLILPVTSAYTTYRNYKHSLPLNVN